MVRSLGFFAETARSDGKKPNVLKLADLIRPSGSLWRVSLFGNLYFMVCKNRYTNIRSDPAL